MKNCNNCLNDTSVRKIQFNDRKICNYCEKYNEIQSKLNDETKLKKLFEERLDKIKGKYLYDVALGLSGGKDSTYVLYQLINKYHLKVKTFTLDNGFLSDEAKKSINTIVKEFKIKHEYITFDKQLLKNFYKYSMNKWLVPCIACSYLGYATMINYTVKIDAGMCIHGRTPAQMLRYYGFDVFTKLVDSGLQSINDINIKELYNDLLNSIKTKLDKNLENELKEILFKDLKGNDFREFVAYFLYHKYDEKKIVDFLLENTNWKPKIEYNHFDCKIHNATKYIYQCAEGRPHILPEISVLVRSNTISKEEGLLKLENEKLNKMPKKEMELLCQYVGINKTKILMKAKLYNLYNKVIKK